MEYESEEFETKEVERDVEEEVIVPQVKTMYRYQGQGMGFTKGEIFILISKKNKDWWAVRYVCVYYLLSTGLLSFIDDLVGRASAHAVI